MADDERHTSFEASKERIRKARERLAAAISKLNDAQVELGAANLYLDNAYNDFFTKFHVAEDGKVWG
jgi:hypothetical protein